MLDAAAAAFCAMTGRPPPRPTFGARRDPRFERESREWLAGKACAACGGADKLECHHIQPFHLYPELEMDPANWWPLCMHAGRFCHYTWGHYGVSWKVFNPRVVEDTSAWAPRARNALLALRLRGDTP